MRNHYQLMVKMTDRSVKGFLANQCMDPSSELYGITPNHGLGYVSAEQGVGGAATLTMAYYTPDSQYYRNDLLLERAMLSLKNAMASTTDFAGVTGTLSVDENHNAVKSIVVIELENGVQVSAEKIG